MRVITFSSLVFIKGPSFVWLTHSKRPQFITFLVLMDEDEDLLGRRLKLIKSYDGNIKSAHVFYRDSVSIRSLKNLKHFESAVHNNLLNSETLLMCICMCLYAYVPFS